MAPETPAAANRPGLWRKWVVDPVRRQLTQGVTPEKVSLSIAVGSALALFPVLGTTTALCIAAGVLLRLNQPILQAMNALCYPAYFPLILAFVKLGETVTGSPHASLDIPAMLAAFSHHPMDFLRQSWGIILHAVVGWTAVAPVWVVALYYLLLPNLRRAGRVWNAARS